MTDQQEWIEHFRAFLESSSLLAHDISGQTHVAQFCADEMRQKLEEQGAEIKFIERLQESLSDLSELSVLYRQFIKDQAPENITANFWQCHQSSVRTLSLHYFKDRERLSFDLDSSLKSLELEVSGYQLQLILYALYSLCLEGLKKNQVAHSELKFEWIESDDPNGFCKLRLIDEYGVLEESTIRELCEQDSMFAGKTYRRSNSLVAFKKALQGKLETVKITFEKSHAQGLLLELKVGL